MKVIYFYNSNWYGGVNTVLSSLFEYNFFSPELETVFVLCYRGQLSSELEKRGAKVEIVPAPQVGKPWTLLPAWIQLIRILKKHQAEIVVSHEIESHALAWPVLQFLPVKKVLWIHSSGLRLRSGFYKKLRSKMPDFAICGSRHVEEEVKQLWPDMKSDFLYPPYTRSFIERKTVKQEAISFIYVGRMVEYKGLADIIEALGKIRKLPFRFIVVGGSERKTEKKYQEKNREKAQELGIGDKVEFVGYEENVSDYLTSADVFVHPNRLPEPFGLVFIEALLAGTPIVATSIGGAKEILEQQALKMGDLVPPNDVEALAAVLKKHIEDEGYRLELSQNIKEGFVNICDPEKSMKRLATLLKLA